MAYDALARLSTLGASRSATKSTDPARDRVIPLDLRPEVP